MFRNNIVDPFPIYIDSPMAIEATKIYTHHPDLFDEDDRGRCVLLRESVPSEFEHQARLGEHLRSEPQRPLILLPARDDRPRGIKEGEPSVVMRGGEVFADPLGARRQEKHAVLKRHS